MVRTLHVCHCRKHLCFWLSYCHAGHMSLAEMAVLVLALVCWQCLNDLCHGSACITCVMAVLA
jgi:hypothetical protein